MLKHCLGTSGISSGTQSLDWHCFICLCGPRNMVKLQQLYSCCAFYSCCTSVYHGTEPANVNRAERCVYACCIILQTLFSYHVASLFKCRILQWNSRLSTLNCRGEQLHRLQGKRKEDKEPECSSYSIPGAMLHHNYSSHMVGSEKTPLHMFSSPQSYCVAIGTSFLEVIILLN